MIRPILVGLALRDDDSAPLALARALARIAGAPLATSGTAPDAAALWAGREAIGASAAS